MMPIEMYIAVIVASSCIVVLTVAFFVVAVYFKGRVESMEKQVARLEGDLSALIHESQGFVSKMQQVAVRATGAMDDVEQITHTARGWTDRADRMIDVVGNITEQPMEHVSKYLKFGSGFLRGFTQSLLAPNNRI